MTSNTSPNETPVLFWYRCLHTRLTQAIKRISVSANVTGTLMVLALVVVVNYDMLARTLFHKPLHGAIELVQFAMVLIVYLQLPDVIRANRLTRSEGFLLLIEHFSPALSELLRRVIDSLSFVIMALIALASFPLFIEMWASQDYFGIPGVFTAPWWPIKLTILVSSCLCCAIFALKVIAPIRRSRTKEVESE